MTALWFAVGCLATYRLARLLAMEDGPAEMFLRFRGWVCDKTANGWLCQGVTCALCLSVWLGFFVAALLPWTNWREYLLLALALSGATTIIHKWTN